MKNILSIALLSLWFGCTTNQNKPIEKTKPVIVVEKDFSKTPDTSYSCTIEDKKYDVLVGNNTMMETWIAILNSLTHDTLFNNTFEFNVTHDLQNPSAGVYLLPLSAYGGGSGFLGVVFRIHDSKHLRLQPVLEFTELSYWKVSKDAKQILLLDGRWGWHNNIEEGMDGHFGKHRQQVTVLTLGDDTIKSTPIGITKHKYQIYENDSLFIQLKQHDPSLADKIGLYRY